MLLLRENIQHPWQTDGTPREKRFHAPVDGSIWPLGAILHKPISQKDKKSSSPVREQMLAGICPAHGRRMERRLAHRTGKYTFPCADGSIKQEGHVVLRLVLTFFSNFNLKIRMREGTPTFKDTHNLSAVRKETLVAGEVFPATPRASERTAFEEKNDVWSTTVHWARMAACAVQRDDCE